MKALLHLFLAQLREGFSCFSRMAFGEGGLRGWPQRVRAGMREGFRAMNQDPVQGPKLRAQLYETIDGAGEIGWGTSQLFFALSGYMSVVFSGPYLWWRSWISMLLLFCGAFAPYWCRWIIKKYITWPRTGYVAYRRGPVFWIAVIVSMVVAAGGSIVLVRLIQPEITRIAQSEAKRLVQSKMRPTDTGTVSRAWLGITTPPLAPELARVFNLPPAGGGVLVGNVIPDSAADKAGLKSGDIILEMSGQKMHDPQAFRLLIAEKSSGTKVDLRILRGEPGQNPVEKTVTAVLSELPPMAFAPANQSTENAGRKAPEDLISTEQEGMSFALKVVFIIVLFCNAQFYLMMAAGTIGKYPWKWFLLVVLVLGTLGIYLSVPGGFIEVMRPFMLFSGLVWLISGGATLYSYLRHTPRPITEAE